MYAAPLFAQSPSGLVESLEACAAVKEDAARLACYDAVAVGAQAASEAEVERKRVQTVEDFGLSESQRLAKESKRSAQNPALADGQSGELQTGEPGQISSTVLEIYTDRRSTKRLFILKNGQIWQETTISRMKRNPKESQEVTISEARFGGYRLRVEGKKGFVAVKRIK
ncbi:hypothetical protein [Qipengyuania sp. DGS5-3]|uniref:hypothetical protein n=1 Tax=Qipengyuania sp. DGS5-3 TaxID=3349632 RepID=UPI0036D4331C